MVEDKKAKKRKIKQAQRERMGGESLETYQTVHRLLVEVGGDSNLRQIGRNFVENEEKSFAYFNYINELNNNSTMLKDRIDKTEILHFELEKKQCDQEWQGQLKELEGELQQRRGLANNLESQYTVVLKFLDQQKTAIAHLFDKMKCNPAPITGKLGCSAQVTDDNVTQFISRQKPLDLRILRERVLPQVMQTEQGKGPRALFRPLPRGKKKLGFNPKSA